MTAALQPVGDDDARTGEVTEDGPVEHPLIIGDKVFACGPNMPLSTLIRYANDGLMSMHHILVKLVHPDDHEAMWDAFETLDEDQVGEAIKNLVETYSKRPTQGRSSSPVRSGRRGR